MKDCKHHALFAYIQKKRGFVHPEDYTTDGLAKIGATPKKPGGGHMIPAVEPKRDHTPRSLPRILQSIETKKLLRGDAPTGTELSKAKTRLAKQI